VLTGLEEKMDVVAHEGPRVDGTFAFDDDKAESFQERFLPSSSWKMADLLIHRALRIKGNVVDGRFSAAC